MKVTEEYLRLLLNCIILLEVDCCSVRLANGKQIQIRTWL